MRPREAAHQRGWQRAGSRAPSRRRRGGPRAVTGITSAPAMLGVINEKALRELGWGKLCAELASRARTPMGRERALALLPGDDPDEARARLARVEEARLLARHERELPLADAVDVRPSLGRAH